MTTTTTTTLTTMFCILRTWCPFVVFILVGIDAFQTTTTTTGWHRRSLYTTATRQSNRQTTNHRDAVSGSSSSISALRATADPVGFIGLGIMGQGMAKRLLTEGIAGTPETPLVIWNRTPQKCLDFMEESNDYNIEVASSPKKLVESCGVVYSMLSTPEASHEVFQHVLEGVSEKTSIVDCATLAESDMVRMSQAVEEKGGRFLEAPVSGSKGPAAQGTLIFLCSGSSQLFEEIQHGGLNAMGKASYFLNETVGYGTRAKLVVNALMATMLAAYGEALSLSREVGLDESTIVDIVQQGAMANPMFGLKAKNMVSGQHGDTQFPLKHAHKDIALACEMATEHAVEWSVMDQAERLFREARQDGLGDEDFSAVHAKIRQQHE